ncbi:hypothetical protein Tco_0046451 [Tanacetum coccineum]
MVEGTRASIFPEDLKEIPLKLIEFTTPSQFSHIGLKNWKVAKLKVLDAIPDIMNKVVASLDKFVDAISSASNRARPSSVPLIGQVVTPPSKG